MGERAGRERSREREVEVKREGERESSLFLPFKRDRRYDRDRGRER